MRFFPHGDTMLHVSLRERFLSLNQRQFTTENTESTEFLRGFLCGLRALCGEKELKKQSLRKRFLSTNNAETRALTTENTESTEIFYVFSP